MNINDRCIRAVLFWKRLLRGVTIKLIIYPHHLDSETELNLFASTSAWTQISIVALVSNTIQVMYISNTVFDLLFIYSNSRK